MMFRRVFLAVMLLLAPLSAQAKVTVTFWSHELGNHFPHAFFTLRGHLDATGEAVDLNYGFTPKAITPAILWGTVPGRIDIAKRGYMEGSDAQFSITISDAQYAALLALVDEWDAVKGNGTYHMNSRNCVTFVQEAARRAGVATVVFPKLMKKPRSYLKAVAAANAGQVSVIDQHGRTYLAGLPPLAPVLADAR